jgi:hypothetical protein
MNLISKKLHQLENNVVGDIPKTKTVLQIDDAVEGEIHKRAAELLQRQHDVAKQFYNTLKENPKAQVDIHALDFTPDEKAIVDKSNAFYYHRVMELFDNGIAQFIHLNDPISKWIFYSRFNWFISENQDWLFLLWQENQVYDDPEYFNLCAGEQAKLLEPIYGKWRNWLSQESWDKYYEKNERQRVAGSIREPTAQEAEEEQELLERENAEEEAKDAKFLKEKCPGCREKCKWYFEQVGEKKE